MKLNILGLSIASLIAYCEAKTFNFNVVSIKGEGFNLGVKFGNEVKPLNDTNFPLFSGAVEANDITKYKYVVLDSTGGVAEEETIERTYSEETSKINEVYNRTNKDVVIPELPQPFNNMYPMGSDQFKPIPNNVIYNIYAKCNPEDYASVSNSPFLNGMTEFNDIQVNCTITIVSPKRVFKSEGGLHVIGYGSRLYKKLSWNMRFEKKFLGRKSVKLRALASDPTFIRENVATELYRAVGVPVLDGTYARLFINGHTYGLYSIIDSFSKRWVGSYIHGNVKAKTGYSYKLYTDIPYYPDFLYKGENREDYFLYKPDEYDEAEANKENPDTLYPPLFNFLKQFNAWEATPGRPIAQLAEFFNIEALLRLLVIDTLTLAQDNFFLRVSNAAIYYNPEKKNYVIIPYDFDHALRGGQSDPVLAENYMSDCFTWAFQNEDQIPHRFVKTLLEHPDIKKRYDVILAKTTNEIFNSKVLSEYIDAVANLIREDIQWTDDAMVSLPTTYNGDVNNYTLEQFEGNLKDQPVSSEGKEISDGCEYGLMQAIELRSDACKAATQSVDTSNNENISDKEVVPLYKQGIELSDTEAKLQASGAMNILPSLSITFGMMALLQLLSFLF